MKRNLVFLCALTLALSLCACGPKAPASAQAEPGATVSEGQIADDASVLPEAEPSDADTDLQEKQEGTVTIEIAPPEGWTKNEGSVLPVHYMKNTASFMVKDEPFSGATLDEVVGEALGIYQNAFENLTVIGEAEPFTVDEKDARKLTFTCTVGGMQMKYLYVYLFAADQTYVITFGDLAESFDGLAADYETILSDIRFRAE
ncbi:MAG TPA: hypothetical protein PKI76_06530 [Oscillospiraceae bacterium]|nr:hypothetical protein [Oscillospiraceae bacterium]HNW05023.1 hypothetical protein [Oscillospiraceae bacterium]